MTCTSISDLNAKCLSLANFRTVFFTLENIKAPDWVLSSANAVFCDSYLHLKNKYQITGSPAKKPAHLVYFWVIILSRAPTQTV